MLRLATIDNDVAVTEFPGGQAPFEKASQTVQADAMVLAAVATIFLGLGAWTFSRIQI